jgi:hypothetical protein
MIRPLLDPYARARSTNIRSRIDSVCERMTRAVAGHEVIAMTAIRFTTLGPRIAARTSASTSVGST